MDDLSVRSATDLRVRVGVHNSPRIASSLRKIYLKGTQWPRNARRTSFLDIYWIGFVWDGFALALRRD